jgi:protein-tyrosine kinase
MGLQIAVQPPDQATVIRTSLSIGAILLDSGRLRIEDVERILKLQRAQNMRFGDAAIKLRLLTEADIQFALSRQFNYPYLQRGSSKVSEDVVVAYEPFSAQVEAFRALRSQLMLRWFNGNIEQKAVAVVSAASKEGRSFLAANLAVAFAQLGERTLLLDADMRQPCQHRLFGIDGYTGLSGPISDRGGAVEIHRVQGMRELFVLPAGPTPPNPIELLSRPQFIELLRELRQRFDVILLDSPPAVQYADAQVIATQAGAALVVSRQNLSRLNETKAVSDHLAQSGAALLGAVFNTY